MVFVKVIDKIDNCHIVQDWQTWYGFAVKLVWVHSQYLKFGFEKASCCYYDVFSLKKVLYIVSASNELQENIYDLLYNVIQSFCRVFVVTHN